jgi:hypothetical protein
MRNLLHKRHIARDQVLPRLESELHDWLWHLNHPWQSLAYDIGRSIMCAAIMNADLIYQYQNHQKETT